MSFHWRDGWHFERQPNGDVTIMPQVGSGFEVRVPALEWCSIVASMGPEGETTETYQRTVAQHLAPQQDPTGAAE